MSLGERLQHAWNAFTNRDPTSYQYRDLGVGYSIRQDRIRTPIGSEKSLVTSVLTRIAVDAASINIEHVKLDSNKRYLESIDSTFNSCLTLEANIDQTGRSLRQDIVYTMLQEGVAAIVPVETSINPRYSEAYKIIRLRVGKIVQWYPKHVVINLYDELSGQKKDITLPKSIVGIVENPFYTIMNAPNSTYQRIIKKLNLLDVVDDQSGAGKLDLIIQLPYAVKTQTSIDRAETRRKAIEGQLANSKYGIAYIDATEHVTQLNRPIDNNLMIQVEKLTEEFYSQLGITKEIMNGTANEETMNNYYKRVVEPILSVITDELKRKFLTKTARSQKQSVEFFMDPFKLVPISSLSEVVDKFTRNEIMTSNEFRQIVGLKPADDPNADVLRNKNIASRAYDESPEHITPEAGNTKLYDITQK